MARNGEKLGAIDNQLKSIGRDDTAEQRLASLQTKLAEIDARIAQRRDGKTANMGRRNATDLADRQRLVDEIASVNRDQVRRSESTAALREEQDRIKRETKEFQQALASLNLAAAQKMLAQKEAGLDAERSLVERAYAQELISASDQALKLNEIEQRRARDQLSLAEAAVAAQKALFKTTSNPAEVKANEAQVVQLKGQAIAAQARLATAVSEGKRLIDAEVQRLDEELRRRNAANASTDALRETDPERRANLDARAATDAARKELDDLERDVRSRRATAAQLGDSEAINTRLDGILAEARKKLEDLTRSSKLESFARQASEWQDKLALAETEIDDLVERGALTTEEAEKRKFAARDQALPQLRRILELQKGIAETTAEKNGVEQLAQSVRKLSDRTTDAERKFRDGFQNSAGDFFSSVFSGAMKAEDALKSFAVSVSRLMLNLIAQEWGKKLTNSLFGTALNSFGNTTTAPSSAGTTSAGVYHDGGVVGYGLRSVGRSVSPLVFAGAQVLHSGGVAGLARNEVPAILEAGEEVLRADNPRHVKNFRGANGGVTLNASFTVNGAQGSSEDQMASLEALQRMMKATVTQWAADEQRQGGMLAGYPRR